MPLNRKDYCNAHMIKTDVICNLKNHSRSILALHQSYLYYNVSAQPVNTFQHFLMVTLDKKFQKLANIY